MDGLLPGESRATLALWMGPQEANVAGRPIAVPPLTLADPEAERRAQEAEIRRANRLAERERIRAAE